MDKLEEIQIKIKKQEDGLLSLEDDYRTAKKKIEKSYENLDDNRSQLTRLYEEFENIAYDFGRQNSGDESAPPIFDTLRILFS